MNYNRLDNETDEELIYRICSEKDTIGSWQDVANILNKLLCTEYTESKFRKQYQAFNKMLQSNKEKFLKDENYSKQLEKQYEDIRKERIKLQTVNVERNRLDRAESRQELYYEFIGKVIETLPLPDFEVCKNSKNAYNTELEYLLAISDIHYGATFKSINNEYSKEIAKERLEYLTDCIIDFVKEKNISKLNIVGLGDFIQGILRIKDLQLNDSSIVKATVEISRLIGIMLNTISKYCYIDYYHVPNANHTQIRVLNAKPNEFGDEDLEYIIGHYIQDLCSANERINVILSEDKDFIKIHIQNHNIIAMHGHNIKNIESSIKDLSMLNREFIDYLILGHWHSGKEIPSYEGICNDCEILISPSFIGSDPYSDSIMKGSKSSVKIYGFDELYGHTETYKIILN